MLGFPGKQHLAAGWHLSPQDLEIGSYLIQIFPANYTRDGAIEPVWVGVQWLVSLLLFWGSHLDTWWPRPSRRCWESPEEPVVVLECPFCQTFPLSPKSGRFLSWREKSSDPWSISETQQCRGRGGAVWEESSWNSQGMLVQIELCNAKFWGVFPGDGFTGRQHPPVPLPGSSSASPWLLQHSQCSLDTPKPSAPHNHCSQSP